MNGKPEKTESEKIPYVIARQERIYITKRVLFEGLDYFCKGEIPPQDAVHINDMATGTAIYAFKKPEQRPLTDDADEFFAVFPDLDIRFYLEDKYGIVIADAMMICKNFGKECSKWEHLKRKMQKVIKRYLNWKPKE